MKIKDIAIKYGVSEDTVKSWRTRHWNAKKGAPIKQKKGAPPKNKNAVGNDGGAPPKNQNAKKHGLFSKWLPEEVMEIIDEMPTNPLDVLWDNIQLQYAAVIRAQRIMWVRNSDDHDMSNADEPCTVKTASEKQDTFMSSQSRAMKTLESMIKQYEEMSHKNWNDITNEQRARIDLLKAQVKKMDEEKGNEDNGRTVIIDDIPK